MSLLRQIHDVLITLRTMATAVDAMIINDYIGGTLFNLDLVLLSTLTSGAFHNANGGLADVVVGQAFV